MWDPSLILDTLFRVGLGRVKPAAQMMARAFLDDPLYVHLFPQVEQRLAVLPPILEHRIWCGVLNGEVYATSQRLEGVAVWMHTSSDGESLWQMLRAGGFTLFLKVGGPIVRRLYSLEAHTSTVRARLMQRPHWYLSPIAVDPEVQGRGNARLLLKPMLQRLDRERLSCFLATTNRRNVNIYQRYGFALAHESTIPGTPLRLWAMIRERA